MKSALSQFSTGSRIAVERGQRWALDAVGAVASAAGSAARFSSAVVAERDVRRGYSAVETARLVSALRWSVGRVGEMISSWAAEAAEAAAVATSEESSVAAAGSTRGSSVVRAGSTGEPGVAGAGSTEGAGSPATTAVSVVWLASLGSRLGIHCDELAGLQPDSVRLARYSDPEPSSKSLVTALDEIAATRGVAAQFAVAREVLVPAVRFAYSQVCDYAAPHCDAPLAAAAERLRHDLECHLASNARPLAAAAERLRRGLERPLASGSRQRAAFSDGSREAVAAARTRLEAAGGIVDALVLRPHDEPRS